MKARILIILCWLFCLTAAFGQTDNTLYVRQFPGADVASKLTAAMAQCNPDTAVPCILVLDPSLAKFPSGSLPSLCPQCSLVDYRTAGTVGADVVASPAYTPASYVALGDSISTCNGTIANSQNCYIQRWGFDLGVTPVDRAVSGDEAADVAWRMQASDNPAVAANPNLYSLLIGTNDGDQNGTGAGTWEANYRLFHTAAITWNAVPAGANKVVGSSAVVGGTCANDTTFAFVTGEACTANASTLTYSSVPTVGGVLYVWYRVISGDAGCWNIAIDGGAAVPVCTAPLIAFTTPNGHTSAMGVFRVTGLSAGNHSVVFTQTHAGTMSILGLGSLPRLALSSLPRVVVGDVPNQLDGGKLAVTLAYAADADADVALLANDGLNVSLAPVNSTLQATTAAADMFNTLHPNDAGHGELYRAFLSSMKQGKLYPIPATYTQASNGAISYAVATIAATPPNVSDMNVSFSANGGHSVYLALKASGTGNQMAINFFAGATTEWGIGWLGLGVASSDFEFYDYIGGHSVVEFAQGAPAHSFRVDGSGYPTAPILKSNSGTRYVCVDTNGKMVSSTTACSGT